VRAPTEAGYCQGIVGKKLSLFERLSSYCLLVVKPGHAASKSNRNQNYNSESRKDAHGSVPHLLFLRHDFRRSFA
jgi:hypothetical protein